jgi:hypothetical protein
MYGKLAKTRLCASREVLGAICMSTYLAASVGFFFVSGRFMLDGECYEKTRHFGKTRTQPIAFRDWLVFSNRSALVGCRCRELAMVQSCTACATPNNKWKCVVNEDVVAEAVTFISGRNAISCTDYSAIANGRITKTGIDAVPNAR